jgi:hypothetical protein
MRNKRVFAGAVVASLAISGLAYAGIKEWTHGFEGGNQSWWFAGGAGIDVGKGLAHTGSNNGWVRGTQGWNAVNADVSTYPGATCTASAWLRWSDSLTGGYMSIRSWHEGLPIINEIALDGPAPKNPGHADYNWYSFKFQADAYGALFYVGLWGNGQDAWIQVDDVVVVCPY